MLRCITCTQQLGAAQLISCKSAKDRTSMMVTYQAAIKASELLGNHTIEGDTVEAVSKIMRRESGVRLQNCQLNTGKARFAFNTIQRQLLPAELRPPKAGCSKNVQN